MALSLRFLQAQPDRRLAQLAGQGHEAAFEALVRRYRHELLGYCRRLTSEAGSAEDTLQQALLQAWKALKAGAEVQDVRAWLYRIAHNVAISQFRAAGAMAQEIEDAPASFDVDQIVQQRFQARAALAGMASLPELQRQVLVSTTLEGASHEQVATALGLTNDSVRGLIYRARAAVRAAAAAVIPSPVLSWAVRHTESSGARTSAIVESAIGGGGAGVAGLIAKGSAVIAITAIAAGGMIVPTTTSHRPNGAKHRTDLHPTGGSLISGRLVAHRARGEAPGTTSRNGSAAAAAARASSDTRSGRGGGRGSPDGSGGGSMDGRDGGSTGASDGGSHGGSTGSSSGGSDGGSSSATTAQSSGGTPGGSSGDSRVSGGSGLSDGGSSGGSGSDGGMSGTSGGQVTTATITSSETSGPDGGSRSSGSGDTITTPVTR